MATRHDVLHIRALRERSARTSDGLVVVEGVKSVGELCRSGWTVVRIYAVQERCADIPASHVALAETCSTREIERMSSMKTAPGILALAEKPVQSAAFDVHAAVCPIVLGLDGISDPGNVGTLIRTALWFGCAGVWVDHRGADPWSAKTIQAAMGAVFHVPVVEVDLVDAVRSSSLPCYILDAAGQDIAGQVWEPSIVCVGSESHGPTPALREAAAGALAIPGSGQLESLNAAVAGGIVLAQAARALSKG